MRDEYGRALKAGQKEYRSCVAAGLYPYPQVLDEILQNVSSTTQLPLGVVEIPMNLIRGTKTEGRKTAFSRSFYPLLKEGTEFAAKWSNLCEAQLTEGIRDPIKAYEFMGRFYVEEGNKRVSVMKYFGAESISGNVTRLIPPKSDTTEVVVYYEYMDFYKVSGVNQVLMTRPGNYDKLCQLIGVEPGQEWSEDQRKDFLSNFYRFQEVYQQSQVMGLTIGDALVTYLQVYPYREMETLPRDGLAQRLGRIRPELKVANLQKEQAVDVAMEPEKVPEQPRHTLLPWVLRHESGTKVKVAFLHEKNAGNSAWTAAHEFGRSQVEQTMADRIETFSFSDVAAGVNDLDTIQNALEKGCSILFSTSPMLMSASLKAAAEHPEAKFLNCSLNMAHPIVRTYYGRIFEAKFITGAIAGALSRDGKIGYVSDYPLYGTPANVNAFALGAAMVNPQAKVYLRWSCVQGGENPDKWFRENGISIVSSRDQRHPNRDADEFGLYLLKPDGTRKDVACPFWNWGRYYERILEIIIGQEWRMDAKEPKAVNYWWGVGSGVVDVLLSRELPSEVTRLAGLIKDGITAAKISPFDMRLVDQNGVLRYEGGSMLPPETIVTMDWFVDKVEGKLPKMEELLPEAKALAEVDGIYEAREEGRQADQ